MIHTIQLVNHYLFYSYNNNSQLGYLSYIVSECELALRAKVLSRAQTRAGLKDTKRMVLRWLRRSKPKRTSGALPLAEAAQRVLELARGERLPLAYVAIRGGEDHAQHWIANNMLQVVVARGRAPSATELEELTLEKIRGLELDADMTALREAGAIAARYVDLTLTSEALEQYLIWARTVQ